MPGAVLGTVLEVSQTQLLVLWSSVLGQVVHRHSKAISDGGKCCDSNRQGGLRSVAGRAATSGWVQGGLSDELTLELR